MAKVYKSLVKKCLILVDFEALYTPCTCLAASFNAVIAGRPSKFLLRSLTTKIRWRVVAFLMYFRGYVVTFQAGLMLIIACNGRRLILLPLRFFTSRPATRTVVSQRGVARRL